MKKLLLTGLALATLISCQKDYYLDDLKAAEKEIAQLKASKSQLSKEISSLQSELTQLSKVNQNLISNNSNLSAQIQDLKEELAIVNNNLNNTTVDLQDAQNLIKDLRLEIAELEIELAKEQNSVEALKKVLDNLQAQYDLAIGDNAELKELIDVLKGDIIKLEDELAIAAGVPNALFAVSGITTYTYYHGEDVYDQWTTPQNVGDVIDATQSFENPRFGILTQTKTKQDYSEYIEFTYWNDKIKVDSVNFEVLGKDNYVVKVYTSGTRRLPDNVVKDEIRVEERKIEITDYNQQNVLEDYEVLELFRSTNAGIYSDELYKTLDFNDINDYVRVFKEDAKRHGVNKDYITNKTPYLVITEIKADNVCAWASWVCDKTYIWTEYDKDCWGSLPDRPFDPRRLETMYHELGHTIMSYPHPKDEDEDEWPENVAAGHNGYIDIMGYSSFYWGEPNHIYTRNGKEYKNLSWEEGVDRFFAGTDHTTYNCGSGKGNTIIVNEIGNPDF